MKIVKQGICSTSYDTITDDSKYSISASVLTGSDKKIKSIENGYIVSSESGNIIATFNMCNDRSLNISFIVDDVDVEHDIVTTISDFKNTIETLETAE